MTSEWRERPLAELTDNFDGMRVPVKEADRRPGPYPYYGASGVVDYVDHYLFDGDYLLVAEDGENLRTRKTPVAFLARGKFWVNNHAHIVRGNSEGDTRFLMYALSSADISGYLTGSTMPKLTQGNLNRVPLLTPPLAEQRAIAHILGTLDDKIELNRRMNETLEAIARALFKSWFVDFDPVRAKSEGRDPGLPPHLADLFPDSFEDSELGEIPAGWRVSGLDEIATYLNGLALQKYAPDDSGSLPVIKIAQLRTGHTDDADRASPDIPPAYVVEDGDVLFSWSGSLEVEIWSGGRGALNQHLFKVMSDRFPKWFYFLWTRHHLPDFRSIAAGKATTMGHIQRGHLDAAKVVVPPTALLDLMTEKFQPLLEDLVALRLQSRTIAALRDALMPKLISGQISVSDAEPFLAVAG